MVSNAVYILVTFNPIIIKTYMKSFIENAQTPHTIQSIDPWHTQESRMDDMMSYLPHTTKTYWIELES